MARQKVDEFRPLVENLIGLLRLQRERENYPLPLRQLLASREIGDEAQKEQVLKHKLFKDQVVIARAGDPDSPTALKEDLGLLAASDRLLEYLLEAQPIQGDWKWPINKLTARLATALKKPFQSALAGKLEQKALPTPIGVIYLKNKPHLFLRHRVPPEARPLLLAEKLAERLAELRAQGAYPVSLERLVQSLGEPVETLLVQQAIQEVPFKSRVLLALPSNLAAPAALIEDQELLAGSPELLTFLLAGSEKAEHHGLSLKDLKKPLAKKLQAPFEKSIHAHARQGTLPADIGWLWVSKQLHLFFLERVNEGRPRVGPVGVGQAPVTGGPLPFPAQPLDFAREFAAAFDRLDRESGSHNFVNLVDLRRALPCGRATFDAELLRLRQEGRYTLSAAEGRHGIGPEERQAGIAEEGSLLLFVSKNTQPG